MEKWDRIAQQSCSLLPRPYALYSQDENLEDIVNRTLALSNIIRGFSFLPGNEKTLGKHIGLLQIIGILLLFLTEEKSTKNKFNEPEFVEKEINEDSAQIKIKVEEATIRETGTEVIIEKIKPKIDIDVSTYFKPRMNLDAKPYIKPEEDRAERLLLETGNHLREDAFVILTQSHVSLFFIKKVQKRFCLQIKRI